MAQTLTAPLEGSYTEVYVVTGRAIDALGKPAARAELVLELDQRGVKAEPLRASTDCFGVYITSFTLRNPRAEGKVKVTLKGVDGAPDAVGEANLDPFYRRTDLHLRYQGEWGGAGCPSQTPLWGKRVSITGRILTRVEPYDESGATFHAIRYGGHPQISYWPTESHVVCPPAQTDANRCDMGVAAVDERGDFRYSWVFEQEFELSGTERIEVVAGERSYNFTLDPDYRVATAMIETTGQGPPPPTRESPAAPAALLVLGLAAVALAWRRTGR